MYTIPIDFFEGDGNESRHIPAPLPTASLLAYYDFALTSSYVTGSSTVYDLSGNGYHGTLSGSVYPVMVTSSFGFYPKSCAYFSNSGTSFKVSSSLTDAFGKTVNNVYCNTPPTYSNDFNFTAVIISKSEYYTSGQAKSVLEVGGGFRNLDEYDSGGWINRYRVYYGPGTGQNSNVDTYITSPFPYSSSLGAHVLQKQCYFVGKELTNSLYISSSYQFYNSGSDGGNVYANNILYGSGDVFINRNNKSVIEAILLYNKRLSPDDIFYVLDWFKYRKV
jgi:hypothetical protein